MDNIIKENLKKIEAFCLENFCSRLKNNESLTVNLNENPMWRCIPVPRYEFTFKVTKDDIYFRTGGGSYHGFMQENYGQYDFAKFSIYNDLFMLEAKKMLLHWQEIKSGLFVELEKLIAEEEAINNFEI